MAPLSFMSLRSFLGSYVPCVLCMHQFHGLVVVPLDLEVRHPAVPLGRRDVLVAQKVLDSGKVGIGVQKLRGEGVPQPMARHLKSALSRIVFDPLLDAPDGDRRARVRPLLDEEQSPSPSMIVFADRLQGRCGRRRSSRRPCPWRLFH